MHLLSQLMNLQYEVPVPSLGRPAKV